tara:strand:- start:12451 stop:13704 length:1254 start_codon:yes stop_codon:yes gene_type:complete
MAFNFGAFIGGASENLVDMIKTKEAQMYKEDQDEKETKRRARVAAVTQRRADEKEAKQAAQKLKLAGFDSERISYALSQGSTYASGLAEYGGIAITNGKDPNTLLRYSENIDEFKTLSGHRASDGEMKLPEGFSLPEDADASKYFEQDREVFTTLSQPASKPVTSLGMVRANTVNKMLSTDPNSPEYLELSKRNDMLLAEIKREHQKDDDEENTDPFTNADVRLDWARFLQDAATPLGMETLEGSIVNVQAGNQGKAYIASIDAGLAMKARIKSAELTSPNVTSYADVKISTALSDLKNRGARIAYAASSINDATRESLAAAEPDRDLGLLEKYKMPYNPETNEYRSSYTGTEALALADRGAFNVGDVIVIDNMPVLFTGNIKLSYGGLSEEGSQVNLPFLYIGGGDKYDVTDVGRY